MFRNYLKVFLRNILKNKGFSFINIVGLTSGMVCAVLIMLWVQDELAYDRFHQYEDRLYRITLEHHFAGDDILTTEYSPPPLAAALKEEIPEIVETARYVMRNRQYRIANGAEYFNESRVGFADPSFFEMFSFGFLLGDPKTALDEPASIIITQAMAEKYFGKEDPLGKALNIDFNTDLTVTGVIETIPSYSHLQFDFITSLDFFQELWPHSRMDVYWNNILSTYVLTREDVDLDLLNRKIKSFIKGHFDRSRANIFLQPISHIHLYGLSAEGRAIQYVRHFSIIAVFVLAVACINFVNLSTARASKRAREVGLRKVVGAERRQLIFQFLGESSLYTIMALVAAFILVGILLPAFNVFTGKHISLDLLNSQNILVTLGVALVSCTLSGFYPAIVLSAFDPAAVLKGSHKTGKKGSGFRRSLVLIQFSLSIILMICTMIVYRQLSFIRNTDVGLARDRLIHFRMQTDFHRIYRTLRKDLLGDPNVLRVTAANQIPTEIGSSSSGIDWDGKDPEDVINMINTHVDFGYIETFDMKMVEGRSFDRHLASDSVNYILNETAARILAKDNVIGERFEMWGKEGKIIGVVKDFHYDHFSNEIGPLILTITPDMFQTVIIKISGADIKQTIRNLEAVWNRIRPGYSFEFHFFDENFEKLHAAEERMGKLFTYFSGLAILISTLGLFGLSSFISIQRSKEIGVRRVLGASVSGLVVLLSREFLKWVVLANLIAWPISGFYMHRWLQHFVYRQNLAPGPFLLSGLLAIFIAVATVSSQSVKAALSDPVKTLKCE